ncbi:hypothetical protein PG993_001118 [Apiospora rasikravindrae]|uniref:Ricin B lectin domain-containing protein n=1 Tax=Apiospora rasikravindrae TaxID=990691 RepID=A0ABR1UAG5_9PEZI
MVAKYSAAAFAAMSTLVAAGPVSYPRAVTELNQAAFEEAQKRDETATRAFSNTAIKTSDGKCLFVDKLSGDFRANLTPVQVAECGSTDGQGWDIITQGEHNNVDGNMLVVNTLTQACLNFDPRRPAGSQVNLFSCGGRADGGGLVTNSQLFAFDGTASPFTLTPDSQKKSCLVVAGSTVDVTACDDGKTGQKFTFADAAATSTTSAPIASSLTQTSSCTSVTVTVTAGELKMKRNAGPDTVTTTELVYVTQRPSEAAEESFSSTTTIFVTVDASPSAPAQGQPGNIPQVSINPTTTVVLNPGNGAGAQPAPTGAKEAPAASAPAGGAAGGIPQVSIGPSATVTLNPGNGAGAAPAPTSVGAGAGKAASSTSAKAKAPASSAPVASAPAGQPIQVSINPTTTVVLNPGNGAAPAATSGAGKAVPTTSAKAAVPAPSAPAASAPAGAQPIQVSIGPSGTVTLNPGNGAAPAPTSKAGAGAGAGRAKAPAPSAPAAAPPAGQPIPQVSINPTTTVTLLA